MKEELLWSRYREQTDLAARTLLIEKYSFLVKTLAATLYANRPDDEVEFDDFYQLGMVGLIESIDRYQSGRGATFQTFATYRIRGAILSGLEKTTERREQYAFRSRLRKGRLESIAADNGLMREESLFEELVEVAFGFAICYMLEDTGLVHDPTRGGMGKAYDSQEFYLLKMRLIGFVDELPEKERFIIARHYFEHVDFSEIAEQLRLSKGRVSQLHKLALQFLRRKLGGDQQLDQCF